MALPAEEFHPIQVSGLATSEYNKISEELERSPDR
jgi:hypothetical protein